MSEKVKKIKEQVKENLKGLKDIDIEIKTSRITDAITMNIFKEMVLNNPQNPAEVIQKMNLSAPNFTLLSIAMVEVENEKIKLETECDLWFSSELSKLNGDKDFKSETSKKDYVISKNIVKYESYQERINELKYKQEKLSVCVKGFDKYIALLQSMGAMLRMEFSHGEIDPDTIPE